MAGPRMVVGWVLATLLVGMSANNFAAEGALTAEAWGFLLLTPLAGDGAQSYSTMGEH